MSRLIAVAALVLTAAVTAGSGVALAASASGLGLTISVPAKLAAGVSDAVALRLPSRIGAVDGRILFDTSAAEVVGVAPAGKGTALAPVEIPGGVAFGAYGLSASGNKTVINVIFNALRDGQLQFRVVIDAATDQSGARVPLATSKALGVLRIGAGRTTFAGPRDVKPLVPPRVATKLNDIVRDGLVGKLDMDVLRAGWESARANDASCSGVTSAPDANRDGCVDIADLQTAHATQGDSVTLGTSATSSRMTASAGGGILAAAISPGALTFTVTSTADTPDASNGDGLCRDSQGRCTLRAAITESNWQRGDNRIVFNLSGTAPVLIQLSTTDIPIIQDRSGGLEIDGYSQPGSRVNTSSTGSNAIPGVELRGTHGSPRGNAFRITSSNNTIRGFMLTGHHRSVFLDGPDAHHNTIVGNWIGFTSSGAVYSYRGNHGVRLNVGAHHNQIGAPALADRNVIGNFTHAIDFYGPGTDSNVVQNNFLCMTPSGMGVASCSTAIDHNFGPKSNLEGGLGPNEKNVMGATILNGVEISHGWDPDHRDTSTKWQNNNNRVVGNWIGFRGDGSYSPAFLSGSNKPNSNDGNAVNVYDGSNFNVVEGNWIGGRWDGINFMSPNSAGNTARNNVIGESPLGQPAPLGRYGINVRNNSRSHIIEGNTIRNAVTYGIALLQKDVLWVRISRNIITDMTGTAIYLAPDPNNPSQGANNLIPAPVITAATSVRASGTGIPGATVEVFRASRNAGQSGLPVAYLGSAVVAGNGTWSAPIVASAAQRVTALQITTVNNTSALGTNRNVTFEAPPPAPDADFSSAQRASTLTVDFTDTSTNSPAQWSWNFGDGTTSTERNPVKTYGQAGQYTVALTVTNGGGTDTVSKQVTVAPVPAGVTYVADGFGRTTGGWGSADIGGVYTLQGSTSSYSVGSGTGTMNVSAANSTRAALLNGVSQRDVDIRVRLTVDKAAAGGGYVIYAVARRIGSSEYRARLIFNANGSVSVNASVVSNGSESALSAPIVVNGLSQGPSQFVWLRARVTGASPTTINVKAWADGQTEPQTWQFTATNSLAAVQAAGTVGLRVFLGAAVTNAPLVITFDDYAVIAAQ
jgi:CSLREA domain-containing protein